MKVLFKKSFNLQSAICNLKLPVALAILFSVIVIAGGQEYAWLHVDGKYIKRSPDCSRPNEIWMGCGATIESTTKFSQAIADFIIAQPVNHCRIPFQNFQLKWPPYPEGWSTERDIAEKVAPYVEQFKKNGKYSLLDCHYVGMCDYKDNEQKGNEWHGTGAPWDVDNPSIQCQKWLDGWQYTANFFKDEPWVMAYEILNETVLPDKADLCRKNYLRQMANIREIDKKHILFVPGNNYSHASSLSAVWEDGFAKPDRFRPDKPYNQVVFVFHEYPKSNDIYEAFPEGNEPVAAVAGRIQKKYNVPLFCTEFGYWDVVADKATDPEKRVFMQEMMEMCYGTPEFWKDFPGPDTAFPPKGEPSGYRMGWSVYGGLCDNMTPEKMQSAHRWLDIRNWAASRQASPPPEPAGSL